MENKVYCVKCSEEFEDGEIVGMKNGRSYHAIFEAPNNVSGCSDKKAKPGIYFKGSIYDVFDIVKLPSFKSLKGSLNGKRNAVKIHGNLENLTREKALV